MSMHMDFDPGSLRSDVERVLELRKKMQESKLQCDRLKACCEDLQSKNRQQEDLLNDYGNAQQLENAWRNACQEQAAQHRLLAEQRTLDESLTAEFREAEEKLEEVQQEIACLEAKNVELDKLLRGSRDERERYEAAERALAKQRELWTQGYRCALAVRLLLKSYPDLMATHGKELDTAMTGLPEGDA